MKANQNLALVINDLPDKGLERLNVAIQSGTVEIKDGISATVEDLLNAGVNIAGEFGKRPLTKAIEECNVGALNLLLLKGADCNIDTWFGTPLTYSILTKNFPCFARLIEDKNIDLNKRDCFRHPDNGNLGATPFETVLQTYNSELGLHNKAWTEENLQYPYTLPIVCAMAGILAGKGAEQPIPSKPHVILEQLQIIQKNPSKGLKELDLAPGFPEEMLKPLYEGYKQGVKLRIGASTKIELNFTDTLEAIEKTRGNKPTVFVDLLKDTQSKQVLF